ncbi:MAG: SGNH/GDSL hydrolase family protein [Rhizomicrobium sp.]
MQKIWGRALVAGVVALCALLPAAGREKPDRTDNPNIVDDAWIRPADVLLIGDSESLGYFGAQLYRSLSTEPDPHSGRPLTVWSFWTCGSDVTTWMRGGVSYCGIRSCNGAGDCARDHGPLDRPGRVRYLALGDYVARVKPRITIVSLGSNMLTARPGAFRAFYDTYLAQARRLADAIADGHSRCIWIGPPQAALKTKPEADYARFVADVGRAVRGEGCAFIDSAPLSDRNFVLRGDPEGIHYQAAGEKDWERKVWTVLRPVLLARLTHGLDPP